MAIVRAVKSGNWSDPTVWNTGALPTSADDVYSNTFTVTIDVSVIVLRISNAATTGVTVGGGFTASANNLTIDVSAGVGMIASGSTLFAYTGTAGNTLNIIGNMTQAGSGNAISVVNSGNGTLNITGNVTGGPNANSAGAVNSGNGTLNITGTVTGNGQFGGNCPGASNSGTGTLNITGDVTVVNSLGNSAGAVNASTGTLNITGTVTGGPNSSCPGAVNSSSGVLTHSGIAQAGVTSAITGSSTTQITILTGPFLTNSTGVNPVYAARWFWQNTNQPTTYYQIRTQNFAQIRPLYSADSIGGNPTASNVRSGTVYGPVGELTGTCAVPAAGSVAFGVPVDNTTGTAAIDGPSIRAAIGLASANLDTQLAAKPSATAIRTELDSNSTKLANLDATVSSRLAASGYTAPLDATSTRNAVGLASANLDTQLSSISSGISGLPSASAIATAVWAAATRTLTAAIDQSSTIATAVWAAASRTITGGTVDTLTNAPTVPTPAEIADAVRTELTPELARVSNCATVETTGDQLAALQ